MNIEQIKKDMDSGTLVTKATLEKLVEAALLLEEFLKLVAKVDEGSLDLKGRAACALEDLEEL